MFPALFQSVSLEASMAQSEGPVVCGIPGVRALSKELSGGGRLLLWRGRGTSC